MSGSVEQHSLPRDTSTVPRDLPLVHDVFRQVVDRDGEVVSMFGDRHLPVTADVIAVARGEREQAFFDTDIDGTSVRVYVTSAGQGTALQVGRSLAEVEQALGQLVVTLTAITLTRLLLALGGVALLVGGIGVANTMVIAVLERRSEIGLRRALGATRRHIRIQFLSESVLLAGLGGIGGAVLGAVVTAAFAATQDWLFALPLWVLASAAGATVVVGALAGAYPAARAAKMSPTAALAAV